MSEPVVAGLVLAADGTGTAGRPTPLLPYAGRTLLDHTLATARACEFAQLLVALDRPGKVRERCNLAGAQIVATVPAAVDALDPATTVLVLLRADQPGVTPAAVRVLLAARGDALVAACRYEDGRGYPYAFASEVFDELRSGATPDDYDVAEVPVAGPAPLDVDTWADYEAVVAAAGEPLSAGVMVAPALAGARRRGLRD
ncbi:MAG TPA: NTP transferase domain-containing protein [Solirubrobacteraceae bacterium]|jgi:molybdenum cofactor cytidylyltransferase|nr:NTP transferase domain-containing protein [Solirubrobacteraceae bacterium]